MLGISGVMALAQLPFASYVASLPLIRDEWGLSSAQAGMIYSAYQVGFSLAALLLIPLTDRFPARVLFLASVWGSAITNPFFPLWATGFLSGSLLRLAAGPCLVGVYVPGIRIVSERFAHGRRGMAVGLFVSAFYLGHSVSLAVTGLLAFSAIVLAHSLLHGERGKGPDEADRSGRLKLSVLRSKALVLIITAYALHAWELYVARVWLPPFLSALLLAGGMARTQAVAAGAGLAALMLAMGGTGPLLGGLLSDWMGRARAGALLLGLSGSISFAIGWMTGSSWGLLLVVGLVYGFLIAADSAIYSAGVTEMASPGALGSSRALQTFIGFGAGVISPVIFGVVLDLSPAGLSWGLAFSTAGVAAFLGVGALIRLYRLQPGAPMARSGG